MSDADMFDAATGEINGGSRSVAAHAQSVALNERAMRRAEERGDGLTSIYKKLAAAYRLIRPVLAQDSEANALVETKTGAKVNVKNKFTSYPAVVRIVRPVLLAHDIIIRHSVGHVFQMGDGQGKTSWLPVITDLIDIDTGEMITCEIPMPISRADPRAVGSAISFGKRYGILGGLGLATGDVDEDDDAAEAMPRVLKADSEVEELSRECRETETEPDANNWRKAMDKRLQNLSPEDFETVRVVFTDHVKALRAAPAKAKK
jgi:hypothetical protein